MPKSSPEDDAIAASSPALPVGTMVDCKPRRLKGVITKPPKGQKSPGTGWVFVKFPTGQLWVHPNCYQGIDEEMDV